MRRKKRFVLIMVIIAGLLHTIVYAVPGSRATSGNPDLDTFTGMITEILDDDDGRRIVVKNAKDGEQKTLPYGKDDKDDFVKGDFVEVRIPQGEADADIDVFLSKAAWPWEETGSFEYTDGEIFGAEKKYDLLPDAIIKDGDRAGEMQPNETLKHYDVTLCGVANEIWYITLNQAYGYVQVNDVPPDIQNGKFEIKGISYALDGDSSHRVPVGDHTASITGEYIKEKKVAVTVALGETAQLNVNDVTPTGGYWNLTIKDRDTGLAIQDAKIYIDNQRVDIDERILAEFGEREVRVEGTGLQQLDEHNNRFNFKEIGQTNTIYVRRTETAPSATPVEPEPDIVAAPTVELMPKITEMPSPLDGITTSNARFPWAMIRYGLLFLILMVLIIIVLHFSNQSLGELSPKDGIGGSASGHISSRIHSVIKTDGLGSAHINGQFTFNIESGQMIKVVGGSGSGKTTLLKILAGYDNPTRGQLCFDGRTWREDRTELQQEIGFVPQDAFLHKRIKPRDLLRYYAQLFGKKAGEKAINDILNDLTGDAESKNGKDIWDKHIGKLSGGQQKRVSIALEIIREPKILILDEPDSGLDRTHREKLYAKLHKLCKEKKMTVIYSTHIDEESCYEEMKDYLKGYDDNKEGGKIELSVYTERNSQGATIPEGVSEKIGQNTTSGGTARTVQAHKETDSGISSRSPVPASALSSKNSTNEEPSQPTVLELVETIATKKSKGLWREQIRSFMKNHYDMKIVYTGKATGNVSTLDDFVNKSYERLDEGNSVAYVVNSWRDYEITISRRKS